MATLRSTTSNARAAALRSVFEGSPGSLDELSRAGRVLHYAALLDSFLSGDGGFVPDYYVAARGGATHGLVAELCRRRVWERVDGGYRPSDAEALRVATLVSDALGAAMSRTDDEHIVYGPVRGVASADDDPHA